MLVSGTINNMCFLFTFINKMKYFNVTHLPLFTPISLTNNTCDGKMKEKDWKNMEKCKKKIISTSKWVLRTQFVGQNTQKVMVGGLKSSFLDSLSYQKCNQWKTFCLLYYIPLKCLEEKKKSVYLLANLLAVNHISSNPNL